MSAPPPQPLDHFRSYLTLLCRAHLQGELAAKLGASDLVQETLLEAHRDQDQCRGQSPTELRAWLRRLLQNNLRNALRDLRRAKRDPAREQDLDAALDRSEARLEPWLTADQAGPATALVRDEQIEVLAKALDSLPAANREAVLLRYWESLPLGAIAERLGRTPAAVAGLLHRGLVQLRAVMNRPDEIQEP
jgi:RNA polymerase sigma-70 factor (ECF subfamily)